jgi:hypothetical protein
MSAMSPVLAPPEPAARKSVASTPVRSTRLQRACACGGGSCDSCNKKKNPAEMLQRKAAAGANPSSVPAPKIAAPPAPKAAVPPATQAPAAAGPNSAAPTSKQAPGQSSATRPPDTGTNALTAKPSSQSAISNNARPAAPQKETAAKIPDGLKGTPHTDKPKSAGKKDKHEETPGKKAEDKGEPLPPVVQRVLETPGQPLDAVTLRDMEGRFGHSFRDVRIHTDSLAAESARAVYAQAYTVGEHIVFDSGRYQPGTPEGRHLLAHELTHTLQQHGLQRSSGGHEFDGSNEYHHLEREAESISANVMRQPQRQVAPVSARTAGGPTLSRVDADAPILPISCMTDESERKWVDATGKTHLLQAKVKRYAVPETEPGRSSGKVTVAVDLDEPFILPPEKGNVLDVWKQRLSGCNLEAIINPADGSGRTKAGLKQQRPNTDTLRKYWLQKVGWTSDINGKWLQAVKATKAAGGADEKKVKSQSSFDPTVAMGSRCQVDHILELQVGGNNVPENMQMLDGPENEKSGRDIFKGLAAKAVVIKNAIRSDLPKVDVESVLMRFTSLQPSGSICGPCCQTDATAKDVKQAGGSEDAGGIPQPFVAGGFKTNVLIASDSEKVVKIKESVLFAKNVSAATLIPGLELRTWERNTKNPTTDGGIVFAGLDSNEKTALPSQLKAEKKSVIKLKRDPSTGVLKLAEKKPNIKFHYDYLSDGVFNSLEVNEDGTLAGSGTITPSVHWLPPLQVAFDKEKFAVSAEIPKEKLNRFPIPGLKVTEASIGMQLGPKFKPEGHVAFDLSAGSRKLLDGDLVLSADSDGLLAEGKVHAFLPGVDNAEGDISYKNKHWSGSVKIETAQMAKKLKYVKSGSITVLFSDDKGGMSADGTVLLDLPGTKGITATLHYESGTRKWVFRGQGSFNIPRLKEADLEIEYDGEHLTGGTGPAGISFVFQGITGNIHVRYHDEKFSGKGKLDIKKGKATGSIDVEMHEGRTHPTFSGKGQISYQLSENVITTVGIEIDEEENVRLLGAIEFPKPITLFKAAEGHYKFFEVGVSIPIPGASIGPIGLKARIDGSLSAGYKFGPGELRNTKIEAAFNPLDEKPDADVIVTSTLYIGASAYISGRVAGSVVVDAGIASLEGGLAITATASLDGHVSSTATIHYQKSKLEFDANFELLVGLAISLALDAFVKAEAGIGPFTVETDKTWNLAAYSWDTGLQFGMKLKQPVHYDSDAGVKLPSFDDIQWTIPTLDPGDMLSKSFDGAKSKET